MPMTRFSALAVAGATALGLVFSAAAEARDLTVVSWGGAYQDAQKKVYFQPFEKTTGIKLIEDSWNGGVGTLRAKVEGGATDWDVVQVEAEELVLGCEEGLFEPMEWEAIGGEDAFIKPAVHECGVGTIVWTTGLSYDADKLGDNPPKSWADFFDTKTWPGKRSLRKGPKYALEFALLADGVEPDKIYEVLATEEGVDRAFKKLDTIKGDMVWWEAGAQPVQLLAAGDVVMTSAYNGRVSAANVNENRNFKIVWPGSIYSVDSWVILRDSPNKEQALKFIAFTSEPEHQKDLPPLVPYGVTNKGSSELIDPTVLKDVPTAPENLEVAFELDTEFWVENIEALNTRFNAWVAQ
ncbi:ABC transporter substrate-binding protein [Geminicoccaceae bacterium 1502E]|nr:ABC transporter substrate-binding protein [Geminicoccaceae bacterium 1502E]